MSDHQVSSSPALTPHSGNHENSTTNPNLSTGISSRVDPTNHLNTAVDATNKSVCTF